MIVYDELGPEHFLEWGYEEHPHPDRTIGFACRRDGELVAIGFLTVDAEDRWWGGFGGRGRFPAGIHRKTIELFDIVARAGVSTIWAVLDLTVPRSREWLVKLGFAPTDPSEKEWTLGLHLGHGGRCDPAQSFTDAGESGSGRGRAGADVSRGGSPAA